MNPDKYDAKTPAKIVKKLDKLTSVMEAVEQLQSACSDLWDYPSADRSCEDLDAATALMLSNAMQLLGQVEEDVRSVAEEVTKKLNAA